MTISAVSCISQWLYQLLAAYHSDYKSAVSSGLCALFLSCSAQCATSSYQSRATSDSRQLVRCLIEMATGLREMSQCLEKASLLKGKCLLKLRQNAKWTSKYTVRTYEIRTLTQVLGIFANQTIVSYDLCRQASKFHVYSRYCEMSRSPGNSSTGWCRCCFSPQLMNYALTLFTRAHSRIFSTTGRFPGSENWSCFCLQT